MAVWRGWGTLPQSIPGLLNLEPHVLEAPRGNVLFEFGAVDRVRGCVQNRANVPQMLLGAAFPIIFELPQDDVLGRRNHDHLTIHFQPPHPCQSPGVQRISSTQIYVRIETGLLMNDVEVPALFARRFYCDYLAWRTIKLFWREYFGQPCDMLAIQHHY